LKTQVELQLERLDTKAAEYTNSKLIDHASPEPYEL
jgi:hypothetical protein